MLSHDPGYWLVNTDGCFTTVTGNITLILGLVRLLLEKDLLNNL